MDSPGGDYIVAEHLKQNAQSLRIACLSTRRCLGKIGICGVVLLVLVYMFDLFTCYVAFNTNGILKSFVQWSSRWMRWTDSPGHGFYVLGMIFITCPCCVIILIRCIIYCVLTFLMLG